MAAAIQTNQTAVKKCFHCDKAEETAKKILQCGRCKEAFYCNAECQRADWSKHKVTCAKQDKVSKVVEQKGIGNADIFCGTYDLPKDFLEALQANVKPVKLEKHCYKAPHDFGKKIKVLFMSKVMTQNAQDNFDGTKNYVRGIKVLGDSLGFQVKESMAPFMTRDHFLLLPNGKVATFPFPEAGCSFDWKNPIILADALGFSGSLALKQKEMCFTSHPFFQRDLGATAYCQSPEVAFDLLKLLTTGTVFPLPFYFEGGNILFATNKLGSTICLMGKETFNNIHLEMILKGAFNKGSHEQREVLAKRDADNLEPIAREMYFKGLLKGGIGVLPQDKKAYKMAKERGIKEPKFSDEELRDPSIIDYATQRSTLMDKVLPDLLAVEKPICLVAQCGYHLDTFLQPGPCGSIFIQDYSLCFEKLMLIKKSKDSLKLTAKDLTILDRYIDTAKHLAEALKPLYSQARAEMERNDFSTISLPGYFYDDGKASPSFHCNFMNGISCYAKGSFYYITGWANVGDRLGDVLMEVFREQLKSLVPGIKVIFIKEGMSMWNCHDSQAGLHCLTSEFAVESQTI